MRNLLIISLIVLMSYSANSQSEFSIHLGPSIPMSNFADDDLLYAIFSDEDSGGAAVGVDIGIQYSFQLTKTGLGIFTGIDFCYNGLAKGVKDDLKDLYVDGTRITYFKYYNIPISLGLIYKYETNERISLFGKIGATINFLKISDYEVKYNFDQLYNKYDLSNSFGFKAGAGVLFNEKFSLGINYLGLGEHNVTGTIIEHGSIEYEDDFKYKRKIDILTITIGLNF